MRRFALALLVLGACGGGAAAGPDGTFPAEPLLTLPSEQGGLHLEVRSDPQPPVRGQDAVRLTFTDDGGAPVDGLSLAVQPWMPVMGHGSSIVPTVTANGDGTYDVTNLYLAMPGTWELRVEISGPVDDHATPSFQVP